MEGNKEKLIRLPKQLEDNDMAQELLQLPEELNHVHKAISELDFEIEETKAEIEKLKDGFEKTVFFDASLTNKDKRDVALKDKMYESIEIIELKQKLQKARKKKDEQEIQLKFLYNKFSSIKYLIRLFESITE